MIREKDVIHIKLFSYLREVTGKSDIQLDSDHVSTVQEAINLLELSYPEIAKMRSFLRFAVNQKYSLEDHALYPGDEIAIISPVSGG